MAATSEMTTWDEIMQYRIEKTFSFFFDLALINWERLCMAKQLLPLVMDDTID